VLLVCEWDPLLGFLSVMVRPEAGRPVRTRDVVFILAGVCWSGLSIGMERFNLDSIDDSRAGYV
jgi:hypothetical protein